MTRFERGRRRVIHMSIIFKNFINDKVTLHFYQF